MNTEKLPPREKTDGEAEPEDIELAYKVLRQKGEAAFIPPNDKLVARKPSILEDLKRENEGLKKDLKAGEVKKESFN